MKYLSFSCLMLFVMPPLLLAFLLQFLALNFFKFVFLMSFMYYNLIRFVASHDIVIYWWLPNTSLHIFGNLIVQFFAICNSHVYCRNEQIHTDCSGGPTVFNTVYCFLMTDVHVKSTRLLICWHDMLMCCWWCENNVVMWHRFTAEHWSCTIIFV